jgi:hypothetical protein
MSSSDAAGSGSAASLDTTARVKPSMLAYANIFPANIVGGMFERGSVVTHGATLLLALVILLFGGFSHAVVYGASKAVFDPLIFTYPVLEGIAPLVYSLVRGLTYGAIVYLTCWSTGGLVGFWDTVVFAAFGFIGRAKGRELTLTAYVWNLVVGVLYLGVLLLATYLGGLTADFLVAGSSSVGAPVAEFSLHDEPGRMIMAFMLITALWIFAKLYLDNPHVGPQSHGAQMLTYVVIAISVFGGYLGTTGAYDMMNPLGMGLAAGFRFPNFWALVVGQGLGALLGSLVFMLVCSQHAIQARAAGASYKFGGRSAV